MVELKITGNSLTLNDFIDVARNKRKIILDDDVIQIVMQTHNRINAIVDGGTLAYGINTGFGKLSDISISKENLSILQLNLLKSHACGVGEPFSSEIVRGIMLLRVNALCKGFSGIRLNVIEQMVTYLNNDIIPVIPSQGSLGASGDLAPLSHMGLTLLGYGEVFYKNEKLKTKEALKKAGIEPIEYLVAKEGLSLINGTQAMCAVGAITLHDAINLAKLADIAGALSLEAIYGIRDAFDERVHLARNQHGQIKVAKNIRSLTNGSTFLSNQGELRDRKSVV